MAYDSNTKEITAPVDMGNISDALGVDSLDIDVLFESEGVNKWAARKPVRNSKLGVLQDTDFKGSASDFADNIYYGIQINGPTSGELGPSLSQIHSTTFSYIRPYRTEGWPYRMLDFDGYKHNALPNPGASFQLDSRDENALAGYYNDDDQQFGSLRSLLVQYDNTNVSGVDFTDMLKDEGESLINALQRSYPCILVTDSRGRSYFTALEYPNNGAPEVRPLYYKGTYTRSSDWSVRFAKQSYSNGVNQGVGNNPWNSAQTGMKATIFLLKSVDSTGPYLDAMHTQDFGKYWIDLNNGSVFMGSAKPIVLPADVLGAPLSLSQYGSARVYIVPTGVTFTGSLLNISYSLEGENNEGLSVKYTARMEGGVTRSKSITIQANSLFLPILSFTASELGILSGGGQYRVTITLESTDSVGTTTKSGNYTFTA